MLTESENAVTDPTKLVHRFHAEATAFYGELMSPLTQKIPPHAALKLHPEGGYLSQDSVPFRLERIVTFKSSSTQVSGRRDEKYSSKKGDAYATLATSVVEGLNILEIVTADRIVSQISTVHLPGEATPMVSFLGTRYENLRIAGEPVKVTLDLNFIGGRPARDTHYFDDAKFVARVKRQATALSKIANLPPSAARYTKGAVIVGRKEQREFSLVRTLSVPYPGQARKQMIFVPNFGTIHLATVKLQLERPISEEPPATTFELTMIEARLGCLADGNVSAASSITNGSSGPPLKGGH